VTYIELKDVCIDFPIPKSKLNVGLKKSVKHTTGGKFQSKGGISYVRALDKITLKLKTGDRIGLIGHNGAGKTTLLRVLAGVYPPSDGQIKCKGKIASLLDISLGFDVEASGYENIFLRGLYLGLSKHQISECIDKISNFTNLGNYLSMPLRTYSSGMLMRLAFAITTEIEPDIILMDEWISVGDAKFMEQAKERLESFISTSSIMVLASHSETLIRSTCNKAILLGQGEVLAQGSVEEVYHHYNFFGSSAFFDIDEYISIHPDLEASMSVPGMAPWMHFIRYGIFEGRSPGCGISLEAFHNDAVFTDALGARNGLAAAERIENIAPFLVSFIPPKGWRQNKELSYPDEFIETEGHPLISIEESLAKYS